MPRVKIEETYYDIPDNIILCNSEKVCEININKSVQDALDCLDEITVFEFKDNDEICDFEDNDVAEYILDNFRDYCESEESIEQNI